MKGASASFATRRAISVLPTPVGPIMRIFFGVISSRSGLPTCMRRQRLRNAMATARFASCWPIICLSSSLTISRGVMADMANGSFKSGSSKMNQAARASAGSAVNFFDCGLMIGIDTNITGDVECFLNDFSGAQLCVFQQGSGGCLGKGTTGTNSDQALFGFDHIAVAGDDQRSGAVCNGQ